MGTGIKTIGQDVFSGCTSLKGVIISEGVTTIQPYAFSNCLDLEDISIPSSVNRICYEAFYNSVFKDSLIRNIYISDVAAWCKIYFSGEHSNPLEHASNLYVNNVLTTDLVIPDGVESIADHSFYGAPITSLTIPASVTQIGGAAFYKCANLTSVTFENNSQLQTYGHHVFGMCEQLAYNEYDNAFYLGSRDNPYLILMKAANREITSCEIHSDTRVIATYAFIGCNEIKTISMPTSVTFIGKCAFQWTNTAPSTTDQYLRIVFDGKESQFRSIVYEKSSLEIAYTVICTNGRIQASQITSRD